MLNRFFDTHARGHCAFPGFLFFMCIILFTIPLGSIQEIILGGLTVPKLMIPVLFLFWIGSRTKCVYLHPHIPYFLLFISFTTPSLILSTNQYMSVMLSFIGYALLFLLIYNGLTSVRDLRYILLSFLFGLTLVASMTMLSFLTGYDIGVNLGRPFVENWYGLPIFLGTEDNPGAYGTFFVFGLPIAYMFFLTTKNRLLKLGCGVLFILFFVSVVFSFSRSAIIGSGLGCLLLYYYRKNRRIFSLQFLLFLSLFFLFIVNLSFIFFLIIDLATGDVGLSEVNSVASNKEESQGVRLIVLDHVLDLIADNPLWGVGYGNLSLIMEEIIDYRINAHNIFLGMVLEFGLIALIFFCTVIFLSFISMNSAISSTMNRSDRLTIGCVLACLIAILFHGLFHEIYVNFMLWFFISLGAVLPKLKGSSIKVFEYI